MMPTSVCQVLNPLHECMVCMLCRLCIILEWTQGPVTLAKLLDTSLSSMRNTRWQIMSSTVQLSLEVVTPTCHDVWCWSLRP